jgi:hypothetical protein
MDSARRQSGAVYLKAIAGQWRSKASAIRLRAELPVHRKSTFWRMRISVSTEKLPLAQVNGQPAEETGPGDKKSSVQVIVQTID